MEMTLALPAEQSTLLLEVAGDGSEWTECFLLAPHKTYLGADTLPVVMHGLLRAVGSRGAQADAGRINGQTVAYALALHETYHTLYFADDGPHRLLFWQDAKRSPVTTSAVLMLTPAERVVWQEQLTAFERQSDLRRAHQATITKEIAEIVGGAEALK